MIDVDYQLLEPETLHNVLDEIVLREGTDYGSSEVSLETKREQLLRRIKSGDAVLIFDTENEYIDVVSRNEWQQSN